MSSKKQKIDQSPVVITLSIDPALKIMPDGQRAMVTTFTARRGDVAQLRQVDVTNWRHDIPATIDDLVRQMMSGFELPAFPNMADVRSTANGKDATEDDEEESTEEAAGEVDTGEEPIDDDTAPATATEIDDEIRNEGEPTPEDGDYYDPSLTDEEIEESADAILQSHGLGDLPPAA